MSDDADKEIAKKRVKDWGTGGGLYRGVKANVKTLNYIIIVLLMALVGVVLYLSATSAYHITYEVNGGESITYQTYKYGEFLDAQIPMKTGYVFESWYHDQELNNQWDEASDVVKESTTLYAKWKPMIIHVRFDACGGTLEEGSPTSLDVAFHEAYETLPTPTMEGKTFVGWKYNGEIITASSIVQMNGEHTLQAMYE